MKSRFFRLTRSTLICLCFLMAAGCTSRSAASYKSQTTDDPLGPAAKAEYRRSNQPSYPWYEYVLLVAACIGAAWSGSPFPLDLASGNSAQSTQPAAR